MALTCDEITALTSGDRRTVDKAKAWDVVAEKNAEIAMLKARLEQAEADRDTYKEQMIRAQVALGRAVSVTNGDLA